MRFLFFLALITISIPTSYAQGVVIDITREGVGTVPDGECRIELPIPDCRHFDGVQAITVGPGAQVALFMEWQNNGSVDFQEVRAIDQAGNPVFPPVTQPLLIGETAFHNTFFTAPVIPGNYATLVTLTAIDINDREDTDQYRFFITVDQALPVELADFQAQSNDKGQVDLSWRTLNEIDHDRFYIERSRDGLSFEEVGAVAGAEEGLTEQAYTFRDHTPFSGQNYYRLRQIDRDETATYSRVIIAVVEWRLSLYPNPAGEQLSLAGFAGGWVEIYDGLGRRMLGQTLLADGSLTVAQLPPGRYLLRTEGGSQWWVKR